MIMAFLLLPWLFNDFLFYSAIYILDHITAINFRYYNVSFIYDFLISYYYLQPAMSLLVWVVYGILLALYTFLWVFYSLFGFHDFMLSNFYWKHIQVFILCIYLGASRNLLKLLDNYKYPISQTKRCVYFLSSFIIMLSEDVPQTCLWT